MNLCIMKNGQMSLCINISIIVTLMIFTGLLVTSLEMILHIYHGTHIGKLIDKNSNQMMKFGYKQSELCPSHYRYWMQTIFFSYYDRNCSFSNVDFSNRVDDGYKNDMVTIHHHKKVNKTDQYATNGIRIIRPKSVQVTDFILALMLIVSVVSALVEMLRDRFMNYQDTSMRFGNFESRQPSIVDIIIPGKCRPQEAIKLPVRLNGQSSHRTSLRTIGACTSTLVHRSPFPIYFNFGGSVNDSSQPLYSLRRTSLNVDTETGGGTSFDLPHRSRLIRRR